MSQPQTNYVKILDNLKGKIRQARIKAAVAVNAELLGLYWEIGTIILQQQKTEGWGTKVINRLAQDLRAEFPDMKGLSERNLVYMQTFASNYPEFQFTQAPLAKTKSAARQKKAITQVPLAQLSWYHHITLLDKVKDKETRLFYIQQTIKNGWSRDVMVHQIEGGLHKRIGKSINNFNNTLPEYHSDLANETIKSQYIFDFLSMGEKIKERDFEKALIIHLKEFMLELGKGFAYVGNQKNINVQGDDFFLDLLFYNYHLHCFVVFELKIGDFKPEYAGKLNFYVNTVNEQLKGETDNPTIGVLLCKTPNETVVKYSLQNIKAPIGVSDYKLANALPKQLKTEMPSIEELEAEIEKEYEELKSPSQKKFDALKEKLSKLKGEEMKQPATTPILFEIVDKSLIPLYNALIKRMADFKEWFLSSDYKWYGKNTNYIDSENDITLFADKWKNEEFLKGTTNFHFSYHLNGFKRAGKEAFNTGFQLDFKIDTYWYGFVLINYNDQQPFVRKLYHEQLTKQDIDNIVETICIAIIDGIDRRVEDIKTKE